jgi:hypothetical protein
MSRDIDRSDLSALSKEDLLYLDSRGQLTPEERQEHLGLSREASLEDVDESLAPVDSSLENPTVGNATGNVESEGQTGTPDSGDGEDDEDDEIPYEDHTNEELRGFLKERGLSTTGTKDELIARLEEDDESED